MHKFFCEHVFSILFLITAILVSVKLHLVVVLICVSLMINETNDIQHLFMILLAICVPLLGICLVKSLTHFKIGLFVFSFLNCMSQTYDLQIIFPILWIVFHFPDDILGLTKVLNFGEVHFIYPRSILTYLLH